MKKTTIKSLQNEIDILNNKINAMSSDIRYSIHNIDALSKQFAYSQPKPCKPIPWLTIGACIVGSPILVIFLPFFCAVHIISKLMDKFHS